MNRAARRAAVTVCAVQPSQAPCTRPVEYDVTVGYPGCRHALELPVCHPHAYLYQQNPQAPGLDTCPGCRQLDRPEVVKITRR